MKKSFGRRPTFEGLNSLEDNCFAYIEKTGKKDDEGRTIPKTARHLPHHALGNGASGTGGTVDLPHLRNALARVNQVKPVTDTITMAELQSRAKAHLVAHAKKLDIGDYDNFITTQAQEESDDDKIMGDQIMKEFDFEALDVKMTVSEEKLEENLKSLQDALIKKQEEFDQALADFEQKVKDLEDKVAENDESLEELEKVKDELDGYKKSVTEIFGEDSKFDDMKRAKETAIAFRESEIKRVIKFKGLLGMIEDEEKELEFLKNECSTEQLTKYADYHEKDFYKKYPEYEGILKGNNEEIFTKSDTPKEPKELEQPVEHYRW